MFNYPFKLPRSLKLILCLGGIASFIGGCQMQPKTPPSSFAQLPICANNQFLQKYSCDTINIEQAASSGDPDAQYALGYLYYYGIGLAQNDQAALIWIRKAAAQDQPLAKQALLIMQKSYTSSSRVNTPPPINNAPPSYSASPTSPPMSSPSPMTSAATSSIGPAPSPSPVTSSSAPAQPLNSQLPSYNQNSGTQQPAIDMLQSS